MTQLISEIWAGLREAGLPEVMLFLPDGSASRCHWNDTAVIDNVRVALLADQDRKIIRILPVDSCVGIGIASPKGTDPSGYKSVVQAKLTQQFCPPTGDDTGTGPFLESATPAPERDQASEGTIPPHLPSPEVPPSSMTTPVPESESAEMANPLTSRRGMTTRSPSRLANLTA